MSALGLNSGLYGTVSLDCDPTRAMASPDADPYVSQNEKIAEGQVVCIVEAMKLMNEIESESSGRVIKILAENGKAVEFGQELFLIDPAG